MSIRELASALARESAGEFFPFPVSTILRYVIDELGRQERALSALEHKLDQHIIHSFKVGKAFLQEAQQLPERQKKEKRMWIRKAQDQFISASLIELPEYPLLPVLAQFFVGVCYDLLSDGESALRWYEKSFQACKIGFVNVDDVGDLLSNPDMFNIWYGGGPRSSKWVVKGMLRLIKLGLLDLDGDFGPGALPNPYLPRQVQMQLAHLADTSYKILLERDPGPHRPQNPLEAWFDWSKAS